MKPELLLSRIRVVLCRPSHPGNIGAAARAMKTMGLSQLCLVSPKQFPDPEADTRATGAVDLLEQAKITTTLAEALAGTVHAVALTARQRDLGPVIGTPRQEVGRLLALAAQGEVALVFGNETMGLSNDEVLQCQSAVTIPTAPDFSSLNLGSAVQVLCYECRMNAFDQQAPLPQDGVTPSCSPLATHDELEGLYAHLERLTTVTGFYNPAQPGRLFPRLRRFFGRSQLERDELNILRGILASAEKPTAHGRRD
jgi:tRNA/rRNA methyltransferase